MADLIVVILDIQLLITKEKYGTRINVCTWTVVLTILRTD